MFANWCWSVNDCIHGPVNPMRFSPVAGDRSGIGLWISLLSLCFSSVYWDCPDLLQHCFNCARTEPVLPNNFAQRIGSSLSSNGTTRTDGGACDSRTSEVPNADREVSFPLQEHGISRVPLSLCKLNIRMSGCEKTTWVPLFPWLMNVPMTLFFQFCQLLHAESYFLFF